MKFVYILLILMLACVGFVSAQTGFTSVSYQQSYASYSSSDMNTYWPALDQQQCRGRQDMLLYIAPAGCQPVVVRSDLLAEQNVPVFCQISALQINPLIDIKSIESISFSSQSYPKEVMGTGFHPAQAAIASYYGKLVGSPMIDNIGYVVVILKRQQNESALPESVHLNLTARMLYNSYNALGVGQASFVVPVMNDAQWAANVSARTSQSFWQGRYSVRVEQATSNDAVVSIYYQDRKISSVKVEKGKTSSDIYVPGFSSCEAALQIAYDGFQSSEDKARLEVTDDRGTDSLDVYQSSGFFGATKFYNDKCYASRVSVDDTGHGSVDVVCNSQKFTLELKSRTTDSTTGLTVTPQVSLDSQSNKYYEQAKNNYTEVAIKYPAEPTDSSDKYGEKALRKAIALAAYANDINSQATLINLLLQQYPNVQDAATFSNDLSRLKVTDFSSATATLPIDNRVVTIRLVSMNKGNSAAKSVDVSVGGAQKKAIAQGVSIPMTGTILSLTATDISADKVTFSATCKDAKNTQPTKFILTEQGTNTACGVQIRLDAINTDKLAAIRILPNVHNTETQTNLSVDIGIEKRAIQLSPAKTREMIANINESIKKWESISNTLGKAVTGLKSACFATAAVLTVKNFVSGVDGTSLARQKVMQGDNGWTARCQTAFRSQKADTTLSGGQPYVSVDDCLRQNSAAINGEVKAANSIIKNINTNIEQDSAGTSKDTALFGTVTDTDASARNTLQRLKRDYSTDPNIGKFVSGLYTDDKNNAWDQHAITYAQMRDLEYYTNIADSSSVSSVSQDAAKKQIVSIVSNVQARMVTTQSAASLSSLAGITTPIQSISTNPRAQVFNYYGNTYDSSSTKNKIVLSGVSSGAPVEYITVDQNKYAVVLDKKTDTEYLVNSIYRVQQDDKGNEVSTKLDSSSPEYTKVKSLTTTFKKVDASTYVNKYNNPSVSYFETAPYKGMPHIVPIDTTNGWYAATQQILPIFGTSTVGQQSAFESSGKVSSFWLCNVGKDGYADFDKAGFGGDTCQQFNFNTGQPTTFFPGLSETETRSLVTRAVAALNDAARQHTDGIRQITVNGEKILVDKPAVNVPAVQCQDYMSVKDCQILFNVCDPVICPASRCNLGGQYPVSDVPSTGIVGSTLLCLPNAREGIMIPVCLTGIQSGIDGFVSLLKNHRDCLQENLNTGKTIGICDQIYSIYACEFFWNNVAPVAKVLLPKLVESAYGQGKKGGGEYLTVAAAWQNTQSAINYFTQQYAVNSLKAFQARSLQDVGTDFCKAFVSIKAPETFRSLVEPDSPPQFNAFFSAVKYSDATIPATSQYKVFYHIFAGKDSGVYYTIYLKNPPVTSYYSSAQRILVASGFAPRGQYASETRDFTAPEGYKELCVTINEKEECGFKEVSSSFAVNYVADSVSKNELAARDVTTEAGCVSGDPSAGAVIGQLATGSVQGAAQAAVSPEIYTQGIIRICATDDPGKSSAPGRFLQVGYCGDQKIGCWLDTQSVNSAISNYSVGIKDATITQLQADTNAALADKQFITDEAAAKAKLRDIETQINGLGVSGSAQDLPTLIASAAPIYSNLGDLQSKLILSGSRAYASLIFGELNDKIATFAISQYKNVLANLDAQKKLAIVKQTTDLVTRRDGLIQLQTDLGNSQVQGKANSDANIGYATRALQLGAITSAQFDDLTGKTALLSPTTWFANNIVDLRTYVNTALEDVQKKIAAVPKETVKAAETQQPTTLPVQEALLTWTRTSAPENFPYPLPSGGVYSLSINGKQSVFYVGAVYNKNVPGSFSVYMQKNGVGGALVTYTEIGQAVLTGSDYIIHLNTSPTKEIVDSVQAGLYDKLNGQKLIISPSGTTVPDAPQQVLPTWTIESATSKASSLMGKYSDNKVFIDEVYRDGLITQAEYTEINGNGLFNTEEDMNYVFNVLLTHFFTQNKQISDIKLIKDSLDDKRRDLVVNGINTRFSIYLSNLQPVNGLIILGTRDYFLVRYVMPSSFGFMKGLTPVPREVGYLIKNGNYYVINTEGSQDVMVTLREGCVQYLNSEPLCSALNGVSLDADKIK